MVGEGSGISLRQAKGLTLRFSRTSVSLFYAWVVRTDSPRAILGCGRSIFSPGSIAKGSSSKSGCKLHLPTSHLNLARSYFTYQLLMRTFRELLHLPTSDANFLRVVSPANFSCNFSIVTSPANLSCQLFVCYLTILKAQANFSFVPSLLLHLRPRSAFQKGDCNPTLWLGNSLSCTWLR